MYGPPDTIVFPKLSFIFQLVSLGYWSKFILINVGTQIGGVGGGQGSTCITVSNCVKGIPCS